MNEVCLRSLEPKKKASNYLLFSSSEALPTEAALSWRRSLLFETQRNFLQRLWRGYLTTSFLDSAHTLLVINICVTSKDMKNKASDSNKSTMCQYGTEIIEYLYFCLFEFVLEIDI